jgi:hypothetical protein
MNNLRSPLQRKSLQYKQQLIRSQNKLNYYLKQIQQNLKTPLEKYETSTILNADLSLTVIKKLLDEVRNILIFYE